MNLNPTIDKAWNHVFGRLFHEETGLIYDYVTSELPEERFAHLPKPDEIARNVPNPSGWGTGMEDCMLNAGFAMDALRLEFERSGREIWRTRAKKLFRGMKRCATVHGKRGFVVRGCAPDGKSCYPNSSRDQFTLFVYGVWRFFRSALSDAQERKEAAQLLCDVATYCEQTITPENEYNLLRLDGKIAMVSNMQGRISTHEIMRLPMFYAAAWDVSGDPHWNHLSRKYAVPGIEENLKIDTKRSWWEIELSQMQVSLRLLYEIETDPALKAKYAQTMGIVLRLAEQELAKEAGKLKLFPGTFSEWNTSWRTGTFKLREEWPGLFKQSVLWQGNAYFMPQFPAIYQEGSELLRAYGNLMTTMLLASDLEQVPETAVEEFLNFLRRPDFDHCASSAAVNVLEAAELLVKNRR